MTKTEWFPPEVKPEHVGPYETACLLDLLSDVYKFNYWTGTEWGATAGCIAHAVDACGVRSGIQHVYWRGLTEPAA